MSRKWIVLAKKEKRNSPWKVRKYEEYKEDDHFITTTRYEKLPSQDEAKDLLNNAVHRWGDFVGDFDNSKDVEKARDDEIKMVVQLVGYGVAPQQLKLYYSGSKGFHIIIPAKIFGAEDGHPLLPLIYKHIANEIFPLDEYKHLDRSMWPMKNGKMLRLPNRRRENGRHRIRITWDELRNMPLVDIQQKSLEPREEWRAEKPVKNEFLSNLFVEATAKVIEGIKTRQNRNDDGGGSFNEMCHGGGVPMAKAAGFTYEKFIELDIFNDFIDNFEDSTAYQSPQERLAHFESVWATDDRNPREFSCGEMWKLTGKDWSVCSECPVYAEKLLGEMYGPEEKTLSDPTSAENSSENENISPKRTSDHPLIDKINQRYTLVFIGGKEAIVERFKDGELKIMTKSAFETYFENQKIDTLTPSGKPTKINLGKFWLGHKDRATKRELVFAPNGCRNHEFNLWRGFAYQNTKMPLGTAYEKCKLYLNHVKDVVCNGDEKAYEYVMNWLAHLVQKTGVEKPGVAIVLRGKEGTGKGAFVKPLIDMIGKNHSAYIANRLHFFSKFNESMEDKIVVYLDEAVWAGSKSDESILKSYITETTQTVERKGYAKYTVESYSRFILSSNEDWVVPVGPNARRYLVLDVSDKHMQDTEIYFKALFDEFENSCAEALYVVLKNLDITGVNIRKPPHTEALDAQRYLSMGTVEEWWNEILEDGIFPRFDSTSDELNKLYGDEDWPEFFIPKDLHSCYLGWCKANGIGQYQIVKRHMFSSKLAGVLGQGKNLHTKSVRDGERVRKRYPLADRQQCKTLFKDYLGVRR